MNCSASPLRKLRAWFHKETFNRGMSEEMRLHVELQTEANRAAGMTPDEARYAAQRQFGHVEGIKETCRDQLGAAGLESVLQDVRYGLRMLRNNPGFTAVTVLTLALGIGATTAIFSIVNGVVLRPLPFPDSGRLVAIHETMVPGSDRIAVAPASFLEWKTQATTLQAIVAGWHQGFVMTGAGEVARRFALITSADYFSVMGVQPILGRELLPDDEVPGRDHVVVLNYKFWVSQFNARPDVIGQKVTINDGLYTIVGVTPKWFLPEDITDPSIFLPSVFSPNDAQNYRGHFLDVVARLKPGVTLEQAKSELQVIAARLAAQFPADNQGIGLALEPLLESEVGPVRPLLLTLLGAVGFLLLISCVNVANLLLVRASSRQKEIAVRAALGASRRRVIRQLLCESLLISILGSALGIALAYWSKDLLLSFGPVMLPRSQEIAVDGHALLFACALAFVTGLGFGLAPALQATRVNLPEVMNDGGRGGSDSGRRARLRNALVVFEVSLALILLIGAGLLMRSFTRLRHVPMGFDLGTDVTFSSSVILPPRNYPTPQRLDLFADRVADRLSTVPGVQSVALSTDTPIFGGQARNFAIEGRPDLKPTDLRPVSYFRCTPTYFPMLRIPLLRGRLFNVRDKADSTPVVEISENLARTYFPGIDPIGRRVAILDDVITWREIVGVVGNVKENGAGAPPTMQVYVPFAQQPSSMPLLLVRLDHRMVGIRRSLRAALDQVDPDLPLTTMDRGLDFMLDDRIANQRFALFVFVVFSAVALALSALGIYGVVAYSVAQRTKEIGIRMALGAQAGDILRVVFSQTGRMIGLGLLIGLGGAVASMRLLQSLLFEVGAQDPLTLTAVILLLAAVAGFACWLPARRATKVDPMIALRHD